MEIHNLFAGNKNYSNLFKILFAKLSHSPIYSIAKRSWAEVNFIISVQILTNSKNSYKFLLILTNSLNFINCHSPTTTTTPTTKQP